MVLSGIFMVICKNNIDDMGCKFNSIVKRESNKELLRGIPQSERNNRARTKSYYNKPIKRD